MQFEKGHLYHIYNQGNNKQKVFFERENYLFFLKKLKIHILPYADILAWCLMPNHFHLMVYVNHVEIAESGSATPSRAPTFNSLNKSIGIMLASYTRAINKQKNRSGALFRPKTKAECLDCFKGITPSFYNREGFTQINISNPEKDYPQVCFDYIHANPTKANLVDKDESWEFSSAQDFAGFRNGTLANKIKAKKILEMS